MALCNITGTVYLPNGLLAVNRKIVFRRVSRAITPEYLGAVLPDDIFEVTDASGNIEVDLLTGSYMAFADGQPNAYVGKVNVPDAASATFAEVLQALPPPAPNPQWYTDLVDGLADETAARESGDAIATSAINDIEDKIELSGTPIDGFDVAITEGFLAKGTGAISSASASWSYTDLIPVSAGQVFKYVGRINRDQGAAIAYYDSNQTYLNDGLTADPTGSAPLQSVSGTVTIPAGVSFIRAATLNTVAHNLTYIPSAASPEYLANEVITVMENAAGTEKLRLQTAINALLSGSAMPSTLANLPGIGDSFTVGANATTAANRFLDRVATALGATVTNYGQGGTVLQNSNGSGGVPLNNNGRDRFRGLFTGAAKKDFALIAYGFNDARYTAAPTTFNAAAYKSDYREVLAGLLCEGYRRDQILVVGPHYITDVGLATGSTGFSGQTRAGFEEYVTAAQEVATEFGVLYFDSYAYMRDNGGATLIDTDDIHPTNEGHQVIANGILQETTVLNQRDATTINRFDDVLSWAPVAGASGYEAAFVNYDSLVIGSATEVSGTSINVPSLGGKYFALVRPIFSAGVYGPQASSKPRNI